MNDVEIVALLDAHDGMVEAVIAGKLRFDEFLPAYADFPQGYALDGPEAMGDERAVLKRNRRRIGFHLRVSSAVSGEFAKMGGGDTAYGEVGRFAPAVALMRLRSLVARHPDFRAEPEDHESGGPTDAQP